MKKVVTKRRTKARRSADMEAAGRLLVREIASQLIAAMAFRDMSFEQIDERFAETHAPGWSRDYLYRLIDGNGHSNLSELADFAFALDCRLRVSIEAKPDAPALPEEGEQA